VIQPQHFVYTCSADAVVALCYRLMVAGSSGATGRGQKGSIGPDLTKEVRTDLE
jgi:hypothetical protein